MRKQFIIAAMIYFLTIPGISMTADFHFGIISAVKGKVEEIKDQKEKDGLPTAAIISLSNGSKFSGAVDFTVEAANTVKVEFYIDGILKATDTSMPFTYSLDTTQYSDGTHTIEVKGYNAEDKSESSQYTIIIDNDSSPSISIIDLSNNPTLSGTGAITADVTDDKGIAKVEFSIDGVLVSTDTDSPYSYIWDTTLSTNGTHTVEAKAYDTANQTTSAQYSVTVNNTSPDTGTSSDISPAVSITSPADGSTVSGTVSVTADASDDKGISKVEFYIDGALKSTDTDSPYNYSWDTLQYSTGTHTAKATAYDTANQTTSAQHSLTVNNVSNDNSPTIGINSPADGATVSGTVSVTVDVNDDKGIASVDFYIDGNYKVSDSSAPYSYSWNTELDSNGVHTIGVLAVDTVSQAASLEYSVTVYNSGGVWQTQTVDSTGNVGKSSSIVIDSNNYPHISYQDYTNQDLKYTKWNGSAWSIETIDSTGNVGAETSIALDSNNYPHISYYDITNANLKYAKWTGSTWNIETVDSVGDVGLYTSLAVDANNNPHIAYYDDTNDDLKYAKWTGTAWNIVTVDSTGSVGGYISLAVDSSNYPHIAYFDQTNYDLKYAKWTGTSWDIQTVDSGYVGKYPSLALDTNNNPHISYFEIAKSNLKYAKWTGTAWQIEVDIVTVFDGYYTSIDLDSNNYPHIAYMNNSNDRLYYERWNGSSWNKEMVDSIDISNLLSLKIDATNRPHISYYDLTNMDLKYATKN